MTRLLMYSGVLFSILLPQAGSQSCNYNQLTYEDIQHLSTNCTVDSCSRGVTQVYTYLFPHLTIPCNGSIVNWTAAGNLEYRDVVTNPTLIIWRISPQNSSQYILHQQIPLIQCNGKHLIQNSLQIYTCELEDELPVQEGDVLGMEKPSYDDNSDMFEPYFDMDSETSPQLYFHRGTTITKFILPVRRTTRLQPLLSVGVIRTANTTRSTHEEVISSKTNDGATTTSQATQLGVWEITGAAAGIAVLITAFFLAIAAIQCCVILQYRSKGRKAANSNDKRHSESGDPYTAIEMREVNSSDTYDLPKNIMEDKDCINISKNTSYFEISNTSLVSYEDAMYTCPDDITMTECPRIVLGELEPNTSEVHEAEERYAAEPLSPHSNEPSYYNSTSSLIRAENVMRRQKEMDFVDQLHQPQPSHTTMVWNRDLEDDSNEPIYY